MNILSFDIEEWYIEQFYHGARSEKYQEFDRYLKMILDLLNENNVKATFFCLGKIASEFPDIVRQIDNQGHEIGCHSNKHVWLSKMSPKELKEDTHNAISALQDVVGKKVVSYRAPAFSIGNGNIWAIEILASEGIERDSSIFPTKRDFGGFPQFPTDLQTIINYQGTCIKEFPISLTPILGKKVAFSGGGYFRFFPLTFIKKRINSSDYSMTYFHIGDLIHNEGGLMSSKDYETYFKEKGSLRNRLVRYVKSSVGTKNAFSKMSKLVAECDYISLKDADDQVDWSLVSQVTL